MTRPTPGSAFVISLDFELHWGVRDKTPAHGAYRPNLLGVRPAVQQLLRLFREYEIAATWATVGFLFAQGEPAMRPFLPAIRPEYTDRLLDPYSEPMGSTESEDPIHFAPTLIADIHSTPRQEIGTHTFSHYYCLEPGQTHETFRADLASAIAIAASAGIRTASIVFPRNQHNPSYDGILRELGIVAYRGNQRGRAYRAARKDRETRLRRASRLLDAYIGSSAATGTPWSCVSQPSGLIDVPASRFLRPFSPKSRVLETVRLRRIASELESAARLGRLYHLWWHPHNFGLFLEENLMFLRSVLDAFAWCRERYGMRSLSMVEVAREWHAIASEVR